MGDIEGAKESDIIEISKITISGSKTVEARVALAECTFDVYIEVKSDAQAEMISGGSFRHRTPSILSSTTTHNSLFRPDSFCSAAAFLRSISIFSNYCRVVSCSRHNIADLHPKYSRIATLDHRHHVRTKGAHEVLSTRVRSLEDYSNA